jgi:hypothetical protein
MAYIALMEVLLCLLSCLIRKSATTRVGMAGRSRGN